ncbi:GTPase domain-containing protein [Sediminicoccus sp. KRV36]|uniref:GTPase domain-containing protein n=1 Tax=Sediminicoccus sp. KRV36 TaxID=3133721 RepID=UPI00200D1B12|nr:GTPase domain-containing protein [Sediminicoccus rosea]UPY37986.1 GTPase domain-containing protein [Sediminicoccus rosea]
MTWLRRYWLELTLATLLALPWLSLFGLGFLWLWQNARVLEWALAAAALGILGVPLRIMVRRRAERRIAQMRASDDFPEAAWNAEEAEAWGKIQAFAARAEPLDFDDRARVEALAWESIELVARHFHPELPDPMARVTLPEALLLTEQVAGRLRRWVVQWPGASRLRISDALWLQRMVDRYGAGARAVYNIGETVYRLGRMLNPLQAAAQEAARYAAGTTGSFLGENMRRKATTQLIQETGRAAIDLYSGRLRLSSMELAALARADAAEAEPEAPLRLLLAGQAGAGKSTLLNTLAGTPRARPGSRYIREHRVEAPGRPALNIVDMPPLTRAGPFLREAVRADMILYVAAADAADRALDLAALEALRGWAGQQSRHRPPPLLVAMTRHDLAPDASPEALAQEFLVPEESVIPLALPTGELEPLWRAILAGRDAARLSRHERLLREAAAPGLRAEAGQVLRGGWGAIRALLRRADPPGK